MQKKRLDLDKRIKEVTGWKKARYITASICFICAGTFVLIHLGFVEDNDTRYYTPKQFLTPQSLWIVNLSLGLVGGILYDYKRFLIGGLSGLISAAAITGATLLYLGWRDTVYMAEIVIPLLTGLIGIGVYNSLVRNRDLEE